MSLPAMAPVISPVFQNYERLVALAGTRHRLGTGPLGVTAVLGLLDMHTGRMPIGLINAKGRYFNGLICYDVNLNDIDAINQASWNTFLGSYVGGGWLLSLVTGFGGLVLLVTSAFGAVALESLAFLFIPALLFGLVGMFFYAVIGITLFNLAMQALPYIIVGIAAYAALCGVLAMLHKARCRKVERHLDEIIGSGLHAILNDPHRK